MIRRLNGARGNRYYVRFTFSRQQICDGWPAFHAAEWWLLRENVTADQVEYRWHKETPLGITSVFEVVR